jgi:2-polyprenyl-3-methyl-5-hydroxy-6-metoxy-1,4-benzoquinol methylase
VIAAVDHNWPVLLFSKSVLKQEKFKQITAFLGKTHGLQCLDIGADNGVISYLLRARGGIWQSADLDEKAVRSIRELVKHGVVQIDGRQTPFQDNEFDRVVIVDFLEHIETDKEFINELFRIIKPRGELIINVPNVKPTLLRKFRLFMGQTDEKHGHLRPGYTVADLTALVQDKFTITDSRTYSKFFSECIDTSITLALEFLKKEKTTSRKGPLVVEEDLNRYRKVFRVYSMIYPIFWSFAKLDKLLFGHSGYMLIAKAKINKKLWGMPYRQAYRAPPPAARARESSNP